MRFEEAYRRYRLRVRGWAVRRYGEDLADDIVQEAFLQALRIWERTNEVENLLRWLIAVAKRVAGHMLRTIQTVSRGGRIEWVEYMPELDSRDEPPRQELALYVEQLRSHFGSLGPAQREALDAVSTGETAKEFADRTGKSLSAVTVALSLGRRRLREAVGDDRPHAMA